jgi:predicted DNA-binding helix-hairpin-helix protein
MRFYQFSYDEILDDSNPHLDLQIDPKMGWALRHPEVFPLDINTADYEMILRIPGIGVRSAKLIVSGRRHSRITLAHLRKLGVALNRAKYFIYDPDLPRSLQFVYPEQIKMNLIAAPKKHQNQISFLPSLVS